MNNTIHPQTSTSDARPGSSPGCIQSTRRHVSAASRSDAASGGETEASDDIAGVPTPSPQLGSYWFLPIPFGFQILISRHTIRTANYKALRRSYFQFVNSQKNIFTIRIHEFVICESRNCCSFLLREFFLRIEFTNFLIHVLCVTCGASS